MRRFTTPTHVHTVYGVDLSDCDVYVTYRQDRIVRTFSGDDIEVRSSYTADEGTITFYLAGEGDDAVASLKLSGTGIDGSQFKAGDNIRIEGCAFPANDGEYTIGNVIVDGEDIFIDVKESISVATEQDCSAFPIRIYDLDKTKITVTLSQLDTAMFRQKSGVRIQINWVDSTGNRNATSIKQIDVKENLLAKEVSI